MFVTTSSESGESSKYMHHYASVIKIHRTSDVGVEEELKSLIITFIESNEVVQT